MKKETTIRDLVEFLETAQSREIPFKNSDMVSAVRSAALQNDEASLRRLSEAMVEGYIRLNPLKSREIMTQNAHETVLSLAYLADHSPDSSTEWVNLGPEKAYADNQYYGRAMSLVKRTYESRQMDVVEILKSATE